MAGKRGVNLDWLNAGASPIVTDIDPRIDWVRLIAHPSSQTHPTRPDETLSAYIQALRVAEIKSIVVLPRHAFSSVEMIVPETGTYAETLQPDVWQIGNEPDAGWNPSHSNQEKSAGARQANNVASWCMEPEDYANLVFNCADTIKEARPSATVITAGFSSGFASWMSQGIWDAVMGHVDGLAVHPYLKRPEREWPRDHIEDGEVRSYVGDLLDQYVRAGNLGNGETKGLWVTEFGTTDAALRKEYYARMYRTLNDTRVVKAGCAFCISAAMNPPYGLAGTPAWQPFLEA